MNTNVTFKDVAKLAGVSTQTVSRVTNGATNVNPQTRKRVQAAIDELGYVPNKSAQLLVRKKAKAFGILTLDLSLQGSSKIVEGIRNEAKKTGYAISLAVVDTKQNSLDSAIRELKSQQVDGILINIPVAPDKALQLVKDYPAIPFVFIDVDPDTPVNQVMADHHTGGRLAAELMIKQERRNFAFINGPTCSSAARLRTQAWSEVIKKAGASIVSESTGDWCAESGYLAAIQLFARSETIDAIMVANDQMALGALRACRELNLSVPESVAVIGFDDTNNSGFFCPPLTTIQQDFQEIGRQAVTEIFSCLKTPKQKPIQVSVAVKLVERQSTAPLEPKQDKKERLTELLSELKTLLP